MPTSNENDVRFRFLVMGDLHIQSPENPKENYDGVPERAGWMFDAIRRGDGLPKLDFVLSLGDQVNGPSLEHIRTDLPFFQEMMGDLPCPFYPLAGNHDIGKQEGDREWESPFLKAFGLEQTNYSFEHGGIRFVMLNNAGTAHCGPAACQARARWLRSTFEAHREGPILVCCHIPLVPMREVAVLKESCGFPSWRTQEPEILKLVRQHDRMVVAVLSGHLHLTGTCQDEGVKHVVLSGLASYPSDFAIWTVYGNRIEVEVRQLPAELLARSSDIHGRPRHEQDFVDGDRPTHDQYVMGRADERRFTIEY